MKEKSNASNKVLVIASNIIFYLLIIAIICGSIMYAFSNNAKKSILGYRTELVLSDSMNGSKKDGFKKGAIIFIKTVTDAHSIKAGDIITFTPGTDPTVFLTHRVIEVKTQLGNQTGLFFVTQGDKNQTPDPAISAEQVVGVKIASIPMVGSLIQYIEKNIFLSLFILVAFVAFIFTFRYYFKNNIKGEGEEKPKDKDIKETEDTKYIEDEKDTEPIKEPEDIKRKEEPQATNNTTDTTKTKGKRFK